MKVAYYWAAWARTTAAALRDGTAPTELTRARSTPCGSATARSSPARARRSPSTGSRSRSARPRAPTLYAGYTNALLGYLPTAAEYEFGGYEAGYGHKGAGLPSLFDPSVERICVETGVRLVESPLPRG